MPQDRESAEPDGHDDAPVARRSPSAWEALAVGVVPLTMAILYVAHVDGANGPSYWRWTWESLGFWRLALPSALCLVPFALGQWLYWRRPRAVKGALLLVAASMFSQELTLAMLQYRPASLDRIWHVVFSPAATGYFTEAVYQRESPALLTTWAERQAGASFHARNKPAGPTLFYRAVIAAVGPDRDAPPGSAPLQGLVRAATVGGLLLALLGALSSLAVYAFVRVATQRREAAFCGASLYALMPGPVIFTPMFDQAYPLLTAAFLGTWILALRRDRLGWSAACGAALASILFMTYAQLVLGAAVVGVATLALRRDPTLRAAGRIVLHGAVVLATCAGILLVLWATTGYDPVASFRVSLEVQEEILTVARRSWPWTVPFDLTDFFLGAGWIAPAIAILHLLRRGRERAAADLGVVAVCVSQILIVAVLGLIQGETARVWIFLLPLLVVPAAIELESWSPRARALTLAGAWGMLVVVAGNLALLQTGTEWRLGPG